MKIPISIILLFLFLMQTKAQNSLPKLVKKEAATQLFVDNKPFLMIAGEIHNSSA
jgi:hypothetical protein